MNIDPRPPKCAACGEVFGALDSIGVCDSCGQPFCARHLTVRQGGANCAACEERRRPKEQTGGVSHAVEARVVRLLKQDVANAVGSGHERVVEEASARIRPFSDNSADFEQRVVEDVQQHLHDTFVDTAWPRCPDHPNHPLWYSANWWKCEKTGKAVAPLGGLFRARNKPAG